MEKRLAGKVVVITGCSSGLGKQMSIYLAELGARLVITDIKTEKLLETAKICEERGAEVLAVTCDNANYADLVDLVDQTIDRFQTIDVLINNANFLVERIPFIDQGIELLDKALHVGVYAHWHLMQLCYPYLKGKSSSIINFVSGAYLKGNELMAHYAADKAAVRALSMVVAREWGKDGIRCNTIAPFAITDTINEVLTPEYREFINDVAKNSTMGRGGDPYNDIAPVVAFLCSEDSRWMTGQNFNVSGGNTIWIS